MKVLTAKEARKETIASIIIANADNGVLRRINFNIHNAINAGSNVTSYIFGEDTQSMGELYLGYFKSLGYKGKATRTPQGVIITLKW
jgi:hypothetical protein